MAGCWPGNGAVIAARGVDLRGGTFVTIGTSFQSPTSFARRTVAAEAGVEPLGGPANGGGAAGCPYGAKGVKPAG